MPRKGENIYKRKDGRWEGRYRKALSIGTQKQYGYIYAKTYREAKEKLCAARMAQNLPAKVENAVNLTFEDIAKEWIENTRFFLKESTVAKYQNCLDIYILPEFGSVNISKMTNTRIEHFRNSLLIHGGRKKQGLSKKYTADILSVIRTIQKYAAVQRPEIICPIHSVSVKYDSEQIRILSESEQERLFRYLINSESDRDIGILISMFTGLRIGEICALKWENIDLTERVLSVKSTMQRIQTKEGARKTKVMVSLPKSRSSIRQIPIPSILFEKLRFMKKNPSAYVLSGDADNIIEPRTMQNYFKTIMKQCAVKNATFHTLRHTFATRCVSIGVDAKILSEILGHANVSTTLNRYVHPTMNQKRQNIDKLSDLFTVR